jgi:SAM-dependent methyltransferase
MIEYNTCPICESEQLNHFLQSKNFRINNKPFTIQSCGSCGFKFTNPIPNEDEIGAYYNSENYISHTETKKGLVNFLFHQVRKITLKQKFNLIDRYSKQKSLLDFGAGSGVFLTYVKERGWQVKGVEPDDNARALAADKAQIAMYTPGDVHTIEAGSFDTITLWHVLEHLYNLKEDIRQFKRILTDDGTLVVAVPNCASYDAKKYKEFWSAYDLPIHLYHFTPSDIKLLFEKEGFEIVEMRPMKFDAFWIGLESEKYKSGNSGFSFVNLVKGFWFGLISNLKAKNGTYSSQIYVLKKSKN